jgi:hypothetical protein
VEETTLHPTLSSAAVQVIPGGGTGPPEKEDNVEVCPRSKNVDFLTMVGNPDKILARFSNKGFFFATLSTVGTIMFFEETERNAKFPIKTMRVGGSSTKA